MAEYNPPIADMLFILNEVFQAETVWASMPATQEINAELGNAIVEEAGKITSNLIAPLNRSGDEEAAQWHDGNVTTPAGFKDAFKTYVAGGWLGLGGDPNYGGQGMPKMLTVLFEEMLYAANSSFAVYSTLTSGAALAINAHGSEELKSRYLPKMYEGVWSGSMCLTEPHAGTDLGIMRTKAIDNGNGTYKITGTKIFITGGDHDLTENIIHLVLAKLPDAPAGARGISLFLVPKVLVNDDGSLGECNRVSCGSIEHKMGIKASSTCVMNFDGAQGYLVGELNKGLACMFTMMNYERLSIGIQGTGCAEASYQSAVAYAKERIQGRAATGPQMPEKEADPIIVHPDVRRMLLTQKAFIDGGRAFACYVGLQLDLAKFSKDDDVSAKASDLVALLTPVAKAFFTDKGFDACVLGQQIFGGHGYIREWGQEQLVRDARIAQIYEGTNGVQALDLMGRKVVSNGGKFVQLYVAEVQQDVSSLSGIVAKELIEPLTNSLALLVDATDWVIAQSQSDKNAVGAASVAYLHLFGYVAYAHMWVKIVGIASPKVHEDGFYLAKVKVASFYMQHLLPQTLALSASIKAGSGSIMDMGEVLF